MPQLIIRAPLEGLLRRCECRCSAGCCGLDAFDFTAPTMMAWFRAASAATGLEALTQLEAVMATVNSLRGEVSCRAGCRWGELAAR